MSGAQRPDSISQVYRVRTKVSPKLVLALLRRCVASLVLRLQQDSDFLTPSTEVFSLHHTFLFFHQQ